MSAYIGSSIVPVPESGPLLFEITKNSEYKRPLNFYGQKRSNAQSRGGIPWSLTNRDASLMKQLMKFQDTKTPNKAARRINKIM